MKKIITLLILCFVTAAAFGISLEKVSIVSTENGGNNDFVTKPVARHVKEAQYSWFDFSNKGAPDPYYEKCSISFDGKTYTGQVKVRGNWTTNYAKKSLRIKFDKKHNMFGLNNGSEFKNWVLLACYKDASFLRDAVGFAMFRTMFPGYYSSDSRLVEVEVNGEYFGVYLLVEQQETKKNRINITEADEKNPDDTNIGYLIEFDAYNYTEDPLNQFIINYQGAIKDYNGARAKGLTTGYSIKSDVYSRTQQKFIDDYMNNLWKICYNAAYNKKYYRFNSSYKLEKYTPKGLTANEKAKNCVASVIDLTSLANMYIFSELVCDPDLYYSSFFMDIDFAQGKEPLLRFEAPWDFDSTMGNKRFCANSDDNFNGDISSMFAAIGQPDVNGSFGDGKRVNPWLVVFINCSWFQELVKSQWALIDKENLKSTITSLIDSYTDSAEFTAAFNATRTIWGIGENNAIDELNNVTAAAAYKSQAASAQYLKQWLLDRIDAVDKIVKGL